MPCLILGVDIFFKKMEETQRWGSGKRKIQIDLSREHVPKMKARTQALTGKSLRLSN